MASVVLTCNFHNIDVQNIHGILHLIRDVLSIGAKLALWGVPIWQGLGKQSNEYGILMVKALEGKCVVVKGAGFALSGGGVLSYLWVCFLRVHSVS